MTPLPPPLGAGEVVFWRLDPVEFGQTWDSGEGSYLGGGRWNPKGLRAVYCALDPATTVLEVAVHKGFANLDTMPRILTRARALKPSDIRIIWPADLPNANWLAPGRPSAGQQAFGASLFASFVFILIPSAVSRNSWNLIFDPARAAGHYGDVVQHPFALDPRLHPAA